jgi:hypothetical protein
MMDIESLKKEIIAQNYEQDGLVSKLSFPPAIFTTEEYATPDQNLSYKSGVIIETRVALHLMLILLISFFGALAIDVTTNSPRIRFIIVFPVLFGILYLIYYYIKSLHSHIIIDVEGIHIEKKQFTWNDIFQTFIIDQANGHTGKGQASGFILAIVDTKGQVSKFDISYMGTSPQKLAAIIEYFKNKVEK